MEPDTRVPTARPCIALTMKNSTDLDGVSENAPMMFQTAKNTNAPTISALGATRSVKLPESITDRPLAMLKAPTSHGSCVFWIPSAVLICV